MNNQEEWDVADPKRVKSLLDLEQKTSFDQIQQDGFKKTCDNIESDLMEVITALLHLSQDERQDPLLDLASRLFKVSVDVHNLQDIYDSDSK